MLDHLGIERAHIVGPQHGRLRDPPCRSPRTRSGRRLWSSQAAATARRKTPALRVSGSETERHGRRGSMSEGADPPSGPTTRSARRGCSSRPRTLGAGRTFRDRQLGQHSGKAGSANTMRGVQARRPSLYDLEGGARRAHRADPSDHRRRGRALPRRQPLYEAHDPDRRAAGGPQIGSHDQSRGAGGLQPAPVREFFFAQVEQGRWSARDPRSLTACTAITRDRCKDKTIVRRCRNSHRWVMRFTGSSPI